LDIFAGETRDTGGLFYGNKFRHIEIRLYYE
jgi:hypothetical protein